MRIWDFAVFTRIPISPHSIFDGIIVSGWEDKK